MLHQTEHKILDPNTLQIKLPAGQVFGLAILFTLALWITVECASRMFVLMNIIYPPLIGSYNAELDIKLQMLDNIVQENGKIDCIFLGSSQFDAAVDPQVFVQKYRQTTGRSISCFNFSVATLTASPAAKLAAILVQRYHPRLIIFGTSARDYSTDFGEWARPLMADPWVRYRLGEFNLRGFLIDQSYAIRLLIALRKSLNPDYILFEERLASVLTRYGYMPGEGNNLDNPKENFIPKYIRSSEDMAGLEELIRLKSEDVQVLIVEVPVHLSFLTHYVEASPTAYEELFVQPLDNFINSRGNFFLRTVNVQPPIIPDSGWSDVKHLNDSGAKIFSSWLAVSLADAISIEHVKDPFR